MKRLALYVFWEKDGIVRDYVTYYLTSLQAVAQRILVIVNGKLSSSGRRKFESLGVEILLRENRGLDFSAWKAGLESIGWDTVYTYDELILCNCSCYGPVYPFSATFARMDEQDCDFWGMTRHPEANVCFVPGDANSLILEHLQSYFLVFRKKTFTNSHFRHWWDTLTAANNYQEEVGYHETKFTQYLEDAGFSSASVMDTEKYFELFPHGNSADLYADRLLIDDHVPLVKRKLFIDPNFCRNTTSTGHVARDILLFLRQHTSYPEALIWQDILAVQQFSQVKDALHLNYILPTAASSLTTMPRTALLCFAYYPDLCEAMCRYISAMPEAAHICIISSREDTLEAYRTALKQHAFASVEFRLKPNRGRDVSAYLVAGRDILQGYELICCVHDKKSKQLGLQKLAEEFSYHCMECCLHNKNYVRNIIQRFIDEPFCGLLVPPTVYFGPFTTLGSESASNEESMKEVYQRLKLNCPMDDTPVAPFGSCFWARGAALNAMFRHDWQYDDFPDEPLPADSTISHGIERIYPLAAQDEGYYTAWCSPDSYAELYMNNLSYMIREYNKKLYKIYGIQNWTNMNIHLNKEVQKKARSLNKLSFSTGRYWKYKILSHIMCGQKRNHYKEKYALIKNLKRMA